MEKLLLDLERERHIGGNLRFLEVFLAFAFDFKKGKIQSTRDGKLLQKRVLIVKFNAHLKDCSI